VRILLPVHAFPPRSTAGVEVYTLRVAKALQARGHDVLVLTAVHDLSAAPYASRRRTHEGVPVAEVVNVHHHGTLERTYADADIDAAAARICAEFRPDCVHLQHLLNLSSGLVEIARAQGARVLLTLHDYWLSCVRDGLRMRADLERCDVMDHRTCAACVSGSPYLVPAVQRGAAGLARRAGLGRYLHRLHDLAPRAVEGVLALARRAQPHDPQALARDLDARANVLRRALAGVDRFLAPTDFARARAVDFGVAADRVDVVPLGVLSRPARARAAGRRRRFGFVGTVAPHKGVHVLVDAFRGVADPDASLDIHGSLAIQPSYASELQRRAAADARIRFHGAFSEGAQAHVLDTMDALVLPSVWWENSPMTVLEALGAGLPVIASRTGGVPEIVRDGAGLLVPPGDAAALRDALSAVAAGDALADAREPEPLQTVADHAATLEALYRDGAR
jgi:glycosyltransferase involved in cell wall biosynthesis